MTRNQRTELSQMQGRNVSLALVDGSRIDDCQLVLAGREKLWVFVNGEDTFVPALHVIDFWESAA